MQFDLVDGLSVFDLTRQTGLSTGESYNKKIRRNREVYVRKDTWYFVSLCWDAEPERFIIDISNFKTAYKIRTKITVICSKYIR